MFVGDLDTRNRVMNKLSLKAVDLDRIVIHQSKIDGIWARDSGPIFLKNMQGGHVLLNCGLNGFGKKYRPHNDDHSIPSYVANTYDMECLEAGMRLEGGSVEVNGDGALLTTESDLLNENRNPKLTKKEVAHILETYLGADQIIWLKSGLREDGRNGQVQNVARWLNKDTVLAMVTKEESHPDHNALQENLEILRSVKLKNGRSLNIETMDMIENRAFQSGAGNSMQTTLSYAGFYIANGAVLVPQYRSGNKDDEIREVLKKYYPGRKIIPIDCTSLANITVSGLHGITQQWRGIIY